MTYIIIYPIQLAIFQKWRKTDTLTHSLHNSHTYTQLPTLEYSTQISLYFTYHFPEIYCRMLMFELSRKKSRFSEVDISKYKT